MVGLNYVKLCKMINAGVFKWGLVTPKRPPERKKDFKNVTKNTQKKLNLFIYIHIFTNFVNYI